MNILPKTRSLIPAGQHADAGMENMLGAASAETLRHLLAHDLCARHLWQEIDRLPKLEGEEKAHRVIKVRMLGYRTAIFTEMLTQRAPAHADDALASRWLKGLQQQIHAPDEETLKTQLRNLLHRLELTPHVQSPFEVGRLLAKLQAGTVVMYGPVLKTLLATLTWLNLENGDYNQGLLEGWRSVAQSISGECFRHATDILHTLRKGSGEDAMLALQPSASADGLYNVELICATVEAAYAMRFFAEAARNGLEEGGMRRHYQGVLKAMINEVMNRKHLEVEPQSYIDSLKLPPWFLRS